MEKIKNIKIFGISIVKLFAYFLIYGFIGFVIETIFGIVTKGVLESRTSFINSPICGIYGIGATIMIVSLQKYKDNIGKTFLIGFIVGTATEYIISLLSEMILQIKWWDYSDRILNIHGRVCLYYSIFWGVLALFLMKVLNPQVDRFLQFMNKKVKKKVLNFLVKLTFVFFILDFFSTWIAVDLFTTRMIVKNDIDVPNKEAVIQKYNNIYGNETLSKIIYQLWGDYRMIRTYPNIKVQDKNGNQIYLDMYLRHIQPYFIKIYDKKLY